MIKGMMEFSVLSAVCLCAASASASDMETVTIGNAGNPSDTRYSLTGIGGVDYTYSIGKYEVTAGQYTTFLNAVAATDTYGLYNGLMWTVDWGCKIERSGSSGSYTYSVASDWADRPVNFVSWGDSARFANWLHNGRPTGAQDLGTTEDGAYFLDGEVNPNTLFAVMRESDATWAIPTEDEWYKAAYHKNDGLTTNYFDYPTSSDSIPSNLLIDPDPGNNATFWGQDHSIGSPYLRTEVGAHENSDSPYGTFDQGGNVLEWTEGVYTPPFGPKKRKVWGGSFNDAYSALHAQSGGVNTQGFDENYFIGIRVVQVPEPSTIVMLGLGALGIFRRRGLRPYPVPFDNSY